MSPMRRRYDLWAVCGLFFWSLFPADAFSISASAGIEPSSIYLGEAATLKITVTGTQSEPVVAQPPDVDGLTITKAGSNHSSQQSITVINGQMTQTSSVTFFLNWTLTPRRGGTFQIPPISVSAEGQTLQTNPATLTVTEPSTDDRVFFEFDISPNPVSVGGAFSITLKLFLQRLTYQNQVLEMDPFLQRDPPALEIPWVESLPNTETRDFNSYLSGYVGNPGFTINRYAREEIFSRRLLTFRPPRESETRNGKSYYVYRFEKTFKAVKAGSIELATCSIKGRVIDQVVGPNEATARNIYQVSPAGSVQVLEPPDAGRPPEWTGAIGRFSIQAEAEPLRIHLGDPVVLTVTIRGEGLWQTVEAPNVMRQEEFARGFKIHDQSLIKDVPGTEKIFRYTLRPIQADIRSIPPVRFACFDPARKSYLSLRSAPIPIDIRMSEKVRLDEVIQSQGTGAAATTLPREAIEGLYANEMNAERLLSTPIPHSRWMIHSSWSTAPLLYAVFAFSSFLRARRDPRIARSKRALRMLRRSLMELDGAHHLSDIEFSARLLGILGQFVRDHLALSKSALTFAEIKNLTDIPSIPAHLRQEWADWLDNQERMHYSRSNPAQDRKQVHLELDRLLAGIDPYLQPK